MEGQEAKVSAWGKAYLKVIGQYEKKFGTVHFAGGSPLYTVGLIDARLIDFDEDEIPELVLFYTNSASDILEKGEMESFHFDVFSYDKDEANKVFSGTPGTDLYETGSVSVEICSVKGRPFLYTEQPISDWGSRHCFYGSDGNKLGQIILLEAEQVPDTDVVQYQLNGSKASKSEYNSWVDSRSKKEMIYLSADGFRRDAETLLKTQKSSLEDVKAKCSSQQAGKQVAVSETTTMKTTASTNAKLYRPDDSKYVSQYVAYVYCTDEDVQDYVKMRYGPSKYEYDVIGKIPNYGEVVVETESVNGWTLIFYEDSEGWVRSDFVFKDKA